MIGLFKQKSPGNIVILLIFGLLLKLPVFLYPKDIIATENDGQLYRWLVDLMSSSNAITSSFISFFLIYLQAILINYLVNQYRMITRQNYLPAMAYLMITSLLPEWNYLSSPLLVNTFVIWMFILLFNLYNTPNAKTQVYNIGLLAGISSYIFFPSACFIICILIGLMILKPFRLNELFLFLLGCTTPYYFYGIYLFLTDQLNFANFFPHVSVRVPDIKNSIWLAAGTVLLTIPFLLGGYYVQTHLRKMLIQVRKNWSIMLIYLLLAFFVPFVNGNESFSTWIVVAAPFAAFHACAYFYSPGKIVPLLLFFITIGYILYQQYGTATWH